MKHDDERTNRIFSVFCYGVLLALSVGAFIGALIAYLIFK